MAAYQSLGQFIATFADPAVAGLRITEHGLKPCEKVPKSIGNSTATEELHDLTQTQAETTITDDSLTDHRCDIFPFNDFRFGSFFSLILGENVSFRKSSN